ncbi:hypothetical protein Bbelb_253560 [Branchiostoma belcheri]|nr:hypothetical protein Bbelb_253560 [Branchiostoma belcheri]
MITSGTGCGGDLTASSGGPVTSPKYPGNYGNNENCEWLITVPEGSIIRLTFDSFHTEGGYDFLTIYDGASDNAAEIKRLTGYHSQISPIISTSNTLFLRFRSDRINRHQGFQLNYISSTAGQCWDPGVPTNGYRDNNSNFTSGQTVRYTCMDGYPLRGTANITCQPNGTWTGSTPTCGGEPALQTGFTLRNALVRHKDLLSPSEECGVIYKIKPISAIIEIIDQESRNPLRKIKEAVHIQLEGAKLNRTEGCELPNTYLPLLRREAAGDGTRQTDGSLGPSLALSRD